MNNRNKIIKFLKENNGYISTKDFIKIGINKPTIPKIIKSGLIRKVDYGLYIDSNIEPDEYYIIQKKYPSAIFSYNTAFYILNLTNRTPFNIDITVIRNKRVRGNYKVHYTSPNCFDIGVITVLSPCGNAIRVYNAERSICDMLRSKNEFDLEMQNRILNYYFNSKEKDIDVLIEYSKKFNIYKEVNVIVEVMMKW